MPTRQVGRTALPLVSGSASVKDGVALVSLSNLDLDEPRTVRLDLRGRAVDAVEGRILTAGAIADHNTAQAPDAVTPAEFAVGAPVDGILEVELPPHSFATVSLTLATA